MSKVLYADMDINKYKTGHTIPNIYPGGFKLALLRFWYLISVDVLEEARPPKIKAIKTNKKTNTLLFCNYLLLKNLVIVLEMLPKKLDPLGLASIYM